MRREMMIAREVVDGLNRLSWPGAELVGLTDREVEAVVPTIQAGRFNAEDWPGRYQSFEFKER